MVLVKMVTASGEEHGLVNTMSNFSPEKGTEGLNPKIKSSYEKKRKDDSKVVKARYINHRGINERLDKIYCKYAGDPIQSYHLIPGYTYDLPMGMIEEVNGTQCIQRSGLVLTDGEAVTADGAPLARDKYTMSPHELVPISF